MKAVSILKPLEFSIETKDESWVQGGTLHGLFKIKNSDTQDCSINGYKIAIGYADIKKVHTKSAGCFKIYHQIDLPQKIISANNMAEFPFEFKLDPNLPVSDKKATFHLLYGKLENPFHIQMPILPQPIFLEIIKLFDTFFRFKVKEYKGSNKGVDFILIPPTSREFSSVDSLSLAFSTNEQDLRLDFNFNLKKLDMSGIKNKLVKELKVISTTLTPKEYLMGKTHLDQDKLLKVIEPILNEVKHKEMF